MALIEKTKIDQIEIVKDFKHIQVRFVKQIIDDITDEVKASSYHRDIAQCGNDAKAVELEVDNISTVLWTQEIRDAYESSLLTNQVL